MAPHFLPADGNSVLDSFNFIFPQCTMDRKWDSGTIVLGLRSARLGLGPGCSAFSSALWTGPESEVSRHYRRKARHFWC